MLPGVTRAIIESEINPVRFEHFCAELCEQEFGVQLVQTSTNYDQGRDARSPWTHKPAGKKPVYDTVLFATLEKDLDPKLKADIQTASETTKISRLIYCSSQPITEHKVDKLTGQIWDLVPKAKSIAVLGAFQISAYAEPKDLLCRKYYPGEIESVERSLTPNGLDKGKTALRLALLAFGSEDAASLRAAVLERTVLELLQGQKLQMSQMLSAISKGLGLIHKLNENAIKSTLLSLSERGLIKQLDTIYVITPEGSASLERDRVDAARDLIQGRTIIRSSLEALTGTRLEEAKYDAIWGILLDFLSELFYTKGFQVICAVNAVLKGENTECLADRKDLDEIIRSGADKISALYLEERGRKRIRQAVIDMFAEHTGPAFEWLAGICERFIALCALGLESSSMDELKSVFRRYRLVLDSDIILSLLCSGEPEHAAAEEIIKTWRRLGGVIYVAAPVLEEVAYHAWISDTDFKQTSYLFGKLNTQDRLRYVKNAFVRTYHTLERNPNRWGFFISQYKGSESEDYGKILRILRTNYAVEVLSTPSEGEWKQRMTQFFMQQFASANGTSPALLNNVEVGKADRDGRLLSAIAEARNNLGKLGSKDTVVLVTSSRKMHRADEKFRAAMGQPDSVLSLAAVSYLISLVPNVGMGLATLRQALFEFGETAKLNDVQRIALRIIKSSGEYEIPWAERETLEHHLAESISAEAEKRGVARSEVTKMFHHPTEADDTPAQLIIKSVRAMSVEGETESELYEARRRIKTLEGQVDELNTKLRTSAQ